MNNQKPIEMSYSDILENLSSLATRATLPLLLVFVYCLVQLIQAESNNNDFLIILLGSVLSFFAVIGYIIWIFSFAPNKKKGWVAFLLVTSGWIPWIMACYLVFYKGFYSLINLRFGFSFILIIKSILAILIGYNLVSKFSKITDIGTAVSDKKIIIKDLNN